MMTRLRLRLRSTGTLSYRKASNLQGVLFEHVDKDFADQMHRQSMHPYSQYLTREGEEFVWTISTLTDEAALAMLTPMLDPELSSFTIRKRNSVNVDIIDRKLETFDGEDWMYLYYAEELPREVRIDFLTATAFRQNGVYCILPDLRLVYQSLLLRYRETIDEAVETGEEVIAGMTDCSYISWYRLQSVRQPLEGTEIPGFTGSVMIRFRGREEIIRFILCLLHFGTFSGVGIKTGMGMGAIAVREAKRGTTQSSEATHNDE